MSEMVIINIVFTRADFFFTEMSRTFQIPIDLNPKNSEKSASGNTGTGVPSRNSKVGSVQVFLK
jgi:hypothetical protein